MRIYFNIIFSDRLSNHIAIILTSIVEKRQIHVKIMMIFAGICTKQVYFLRSFENNLYSGASLQYHNVLCVYVLPLS